VFSIVHAAILRDAAKRPLLAPSTEMDHFTSSQDDGSAS
jgi:hypothetical protein